MPWIESHVELANHPKKLDLQARMEWSHIEAIGALHSFWYWVLQYAPTGDLRKFNDGQLAGGAGLSAVDGKKFVAAMVASCWIDRSEGVFRVHDWPDYAGRYLKDSKFKGNPARWLEVLELYGRTVPAETPQKVGGKSAVPTNQPTNLPHRKSAADAAGEREAGRLKLTPRQLAKVEP